MGGSFVSYLMFIGSCWVGLMGPDGGVGRLDVDGEAGQPWVVLRDV